MSQPVRGWADGPPMLPWLAEYYPELFDVPGFERRHWFYRAGFALRSLIHWPAFAPEPELPKNHGLRQLRHLAVAQATGMVPSWPEHGTVLAVPQVRVAARWNSCPGPASIEVQVTGMAGTAAHRRHPDARTE